MAVAQSTIVLNALVSGYRFRQYQFLEQIGAGGQGVVWSALDSARQRIVAIKLNEVPQTDQEQVDDLMFERQAGKLLKLRHAHVLPVYEYGLENQVRYLVSPYIPGGSLFERIKAGPLLVEEILRFSREIALALDYLHSQEVIHRDLKSSNILMNLKRHTYLADFGLARVVTATTQSMHTGRGTPPYSPPEQHKMAEITPGSDIYSFGILLFELFTGQLPWNGERVLGIQQLYSKAELPDPREINPDLPPLMSDVLRRITSADPALRPHSAGEVMKMIEYILHAPPIHISPSSLREEAEIRRQDADVLLRRSMAKWETGEGTPELGRTRFALVDLDGTREGQAFTPSQLARFMLFNSLAYGYQDDFWWSQVKDPGGRLFVASTLLAGRDEAVAPRVLGHLAADAEIRTLPEGLPYRITASILEMAAGTGNPGLRSQLVKVLPALIPSPANWTDSSLDPNHVQLLARLAIEDSDVGDAAARLAGHLRSQSTVRQILDQAAADRLVPALLMIQQTAGSLPAFVKGGIRVRLLLEWVLHRLTAQPVNLIGGYGAAFGGAAFGIGLQVFLTYHLPDFLDAARISTSLEQGLIIGALFGLGILLARLLTERFPGPGSLLRLVLGTMIGGLAMNAALFIFHVLFINTAPRGFLMTLGCAWIALGFALGGLIRPVWARMALSTAAVFSAIIGSWWLHITLAGSPVELTPIFRYDYAWTLAQVSVTALAVSLLIGIFSNLVSLRLNE